MSFLIRHSAAISKSQNRRNFQTLEPLSTPQIALSQRPARQVSHLFPKAYRTIAFLLFDFRINGHFT